jgi:integrase
MRKHLTARSVEALPAAPSGTRYDVHDAIVPGFGVRVSSRQKTFTLTARFAGSQCPSRRTIGIAGKIDLAAAREIARGWLERIGEGPVPTFDILKLRGIAPTETFGEVVQEFLKKHVRKEGVRGATPLRSAIEVERMFNHYLLEDSTRSARWRDLKITDIRRRHVTALLDRLEVNNGPVMADNVLAQLSCVFNWYAARSDEYMSPIVRGMRRSKSRERARTRILSDDEIRALWKVSDVTGAYGGLLQFALLTGQRRTKIAQMRWDDVSLQGKWSIPSEKREKTNAESLQLSTLAMKVVRSQSRSELSDYVFAGRFEKPLNGFSKGKRNFDALVEAEAGMSVPHWVVHDLRRTAKSLMARCGVPREISERVLGHAIPGVEGIYDRHSYDAEKTVAVKKLSALVSRILKVGAR